MGENDNKKVKAPFFTLVAVLQFFFTVTGGGMLGAGIISGINCGWDIVSEDNIGRIAILLTSFGGLMFLIGIGLSIVLYRLVVNFYGNGK